MAMPWCKCEEIADEYRSGVRDVKQLTALFDACFRIQREAIEVAGASHPAGGRERGRGAIPWVGKSRWNCGSFHLGRCTGADADDEVDQELWRLMVQHRRKSDQSS